jgi:hypothetical protein
MMRQDLHLPKSDAKRPSYSLGVDMTSHHIHNMPDSTHRVIALSFYYHHGLSGLSDTQAKKLAAKFVHCTPRTLHTWIKDFDDSMGELPESQRGKHSKLESLLVDEDISKRARAWVLENAMVRGVPNMRAVDFQTWVNSTLLPSKIPDNCPQISEDTARRWLHRLGFKHCSHRTGAYKDGHEKAENAHETQTLTFSFQSD